MMRITRTIPLAAVAALLVAGCSSGEDDHFLRGHGLHVAKLAPDARVPVYEAALGAAFELSDPALTLVLDPRLLPRAGGMAADGRLPAAIESGLRQQGVIHGVCEPPITTSHKTPRCTARGPGYVVRFSDVLARSGDSVEVYVAVQKFDTPTSGASESLRFERAYQLIHHGGEWQTIREARVRETTPDAQAARS